MSKRLRFKPGDLAIVINRPRYSGPDMRGQVVTVLEILTRTVYTSDGRAINPDYRIDAEPLNAEADGVGAWDSDLMPLNPDEEQFTHEQAAETA